MDATERLLREQAIAHGLDNYAPEPVDPLTPADIEAAIRGDAEADEAELHSIAGLRGGHVAARDEGGGSFTIGARWRAAPEAEAAAPPPRAIDLAAFASAEALEDLGLDALKHALARRGAKAGGSLKERAARLWRLRGLAPGADLPDDLKPSKRKKAKKPAAEEAKPEAKQKKKRKLGPDHPWPAEPRRPRPEAPRAPLIAAAKLSKREAAILDFVGGVPSSRR